MGRPKKYDDLYGRQEAYLKTPAGKKAVKKYEAREDRRASQRERARIRRGTIVDKRQWFIETYGDIEAALSLLDEKEKFIITHLYALDNGKRMTQTALAEQLNVSQQMISLLKKAALKKLLPLQQEPQSTDEKKV
ncbi:MAG: sigma factor-like helix-turn-helix DNA-binding protein [Prochloraceae cyanobacterium]|nr:sigma factor-like helix-turn-helix DNA-binding protein [Prochloraceae cyanobacterium]